MCNNSKKVKITDQVKDIDNPKDLRFNNFEPREYEYKDLERKLLGWDKQFSL